MYIHRIGVPQTLNPDPNPNRRARMTSPLLHRLGLWDGVDPERLIMWGPRAKEGEEIMVDVDTGPYDVKLVPNTVG